MKGTETVIFKRYFKGLTEAPFGWESYAFTSEFVMHPWVFSELTQNTTLGI